MFWILKKYQPSQIILSLPAVPTGTRFRPWPIRWRKRWEKPDLSQKAVEGYRNANWILLDYGDVVLHIFDEGKQIIL